MTLTRRWLGDGGHPAEAWWRDASVALHLASDAAEIARMKAPVDFFVSLAFSTEFKDAPFALPHKPEDTVYYALDAGHGIAPLVGLACTRPDLLRSLADAPLPPRSEWRSYEDPLRPFRAKLLQRVLDRKPYGDLLELATALDPNESTRWLIYFMSEVQKPELPKILATANPAVKGWYAAVDS